MGYAMLLPPLVHKVRQGVKAWRDSGYAGASRDDTRAADALVPQRAHDAAGGRHGAAVPVVFRATGGRRVGHLALRNRARARSLCLDEATTAPGAFRQGMFSEDWTRYVLKLATGAGKTKVMSLLMAWCYFHKRYEPDSELSTNFLLIAPNIIVLDRLRYGFRRGLKIFFEDPILPANGYEGQNWQDDFQLTVHMQDEIGLVSRTGNIFLTNIHRVYEGDNPPTFEDADTIGLFPRASAGRQDDGQPVDLGIIIREVPDLVVLNDEAHHLHDPQRAWFKAIEDIALRLRQKGSQLSAQFDLTATPKHDNGAIFVQTISDYPLVEAIRQGVVKTPVLPDQASRAKLQRAQERQVHRAIRRLSASRLPGMEEGLRELLPTGKKVDPVRDDRRHPQLR